MKTAGFILSMILIFSSNGFSQDGNPQGGKILFSGVVRDATTLAPLPNSQIRVNRIFSSVSDEEGTFALRVNRNDTLVFSLLGYQNAHIVVSDSLTGNEFMAGVYLRTDTLSIGEVIIMPRLVNLRSDILNTPPTKSTEMENAKYNMAVSAYQGRVAIGKLDDPSTHYSVLQNRQFIRAIDKGGIPSDQMVSLNPLLLIPAAYLLIHGFPVPEPPMKSNLTRQELDQIQKKYLESVQIKK
jgi:hypothetical protein